MSLIILHGSRLPVVRIMRIAGQYAKPRSKPTETVELDMCETTSHGQSVMRKEKKEVLSFRGDNVNGYDATDRKPDPQRLLGQVASISPLEMLMSTAPIFTRPQHLTTSVRYFRPDSLVCKNPSTGLSLMSGPLNCRRPSQASSRACRIVLTSCGLLQVEQEAEIEVAWRRWICTPGQSWLSTTVEPN